jgi:hypothetical protein
MTDQDFVRICVSEICRKNGYDNQDILVQRDYETISLEIESRTGTLISVSTLKRLLKGEFSKIPQSATLNAISAYLGYKNWQEYKNSTRLLNQPAAVATDVPKPARPKKVLVYALPAVILLVAALIIMLSLKSKSISGFANAKFSFKKTTSNDIPNSVVFSYDVTGVNADSFFIQQSWDDSRRVRLPKDGHTLTDIYYEPGYHIAKLIANDSVIKTLDVSIPTDRWFLYAKEKKPKSYPQYIDPSNATREGIFAVTKEDLIRASIPTDKEATYVYSYFPSNISVSSDSYVFESRIRMTEVKKNFCPYLMVEVFCQRHFTYFISTPKGCTSESAVQFGESAKNGKLNDLSSFGLDVFQWHDVKVEVKNKQVTIYIDNNQVYTDKYKESSGKITGLGFISNGLPEIEHVSLKGLNEELVYESEFVR